MILQNLACIEATINPSDKRILFNKDILRGKKIIGLYIYSSDEDRVILSPYNQNQIVQVSEIDSLSLFLNLQDTNKQKFVKDYAHNNFSFNSMNDHFIEHFFMKVIDIDNSYFTYKGDLTEPIKILIYVMYQTHNFIKFNDEVNGSITVELPINSAYQDIRLSDIINYSLKGKKISKIIVNGDTSGYLDLVCKNHTLNNIPASWLQINSTKAFYLDDVEINFEKSFFRQRSFTPVNEKSYLTFIY